MNNKIDPCDTMRVNLIAAAIGLQQCTKTASNIVPIPGGDRVIAIGTPAQVRELLGAAPWSKEPPAEQGEYWNWDGDEDHAPMIYHVLWSGTEKKCFVSMGQYGIDEAIWCDNFGGWWMPIEQPRTPDRAQITDKE